jgi:hypothetical protein
MPSGGVQRGRRSGDLIATSVDRGVGFPHLAHWVAIRQIRYLAALNPETAAALHPAIEAPAEYEPAQHMDPAAIADVASWLTTVQAGVA